MRGVERKWALVGHASAYGSGLVRSQEGVFVNEARGVYAIARGVTGQGFGAVGVQVVRRHFERALSEFSDTRSALTHALETAHDRLAARVREPAPLWAAVTGACLVQGLLVTVHVGDCAIFMLRDGGLQRITRDDVTRVAAEGKNRVLCNKLLGFGAMDIETLQLPVALGDQFVLLSSGAIDALPLESVATMMAGANPAGDIVDRAVARLPQRCATAIVLRVTGR